MEKTLKPLFFAKRFIQHKWTIKMKPARYLVATFFLIQFNAILYAQKADYFPLEIGNKWIYDWEGFNGQITGELVNTLSISKQ